MRPDDIHIAQGDWQALGKAAADLRRRVFVDEQQVPEEEEWDGQDSECRHFVVYTDNEPVGTARLLPDGHIGRVALLPQVRGHGIGLALMRHVIDVARLEGHAEVVLSAQIYALPFYERLGFQAYGPEYLDAGIPHRSMRLPLSC